MRILHVMRSPVGGLFRHVCDLVREQHKLGAEVGLVCDDLTGGEGAQSRLAELQPLCKLGIHRLSAPRLPSAKDFANIPKVAALARATQCTVLHGHGAKGGFYARLAARKCAIPSVYTAHGGSLHYAWTSPAGLAFLSAEKWLARSGGNMIFVCEFERRLFEQKIGKPGGLTTVIYNGLNPAEFEPVTLAPGAADFLFVGEMRQLKGVDVLLQALRQVEGASLALVGAGPDLDRFKSQAEAANLQTQTSFLGPMPMRAALERGRTLVVPSRNESYPYVVLEALAAGRTVLASAVGGIPEVLPPEFLFPSEGVQDLTDLLQRNLVEPSNFNNLSDIARAGLKASNTTTEMARRTCEFYVQLKN